MCGCTLAVFLGLAAETTARVVAPVAVAHPPEVAHIVVGFGNTIRIAVLETSSGTVRLGITAPADVLIYREEIYREIAAANKAAMGEAGTAES